MLFPDRRPQCLFLLLSTLLTTSWAIPIGPRSRRQYSEDEEVIEGASGESRGSVDLSKGGLIAIIVVASLVAIFGVISAILFYLAKKRQWAVRASIKRSARRAADSIKSPITPRFPKTGNSRPTTATRPQANGGKAQASRAPPPPQPTKNSSQQKAHQKAHPHPSSRPEAKVMRAERDPEKAKETSSKEAAAKPDPKSDDTASPPWWKRMLPTHRGGT